MTSLATAHGVDETYRHVAKHARPASSIGLGDALLKWYDVALPDEPVPSEVQALARRALPEVLVLGREAQMLVALLVHAALPLLARR